MRKGDLKENDSKFRSVEVTRAFQYNAALPDWRLDFGQIEWELGGERQSRLSGSLQPSIITKMNDPKQKWFSFSFDKQFVPCMEYWEMWPMLEQKDLWSGIVLGIRVWNLPFERSHADLAALFPTCLSVKNSFWHLRNWFARFSSSWEPKEFESANRKKWKGQPQNGPINYLAKNKRDLSRLK